MKLFLFLVSFIFAVQASASFQTYTGEKARELYRFLKLNPQFVTSGGGGGGATMGTSYYFETYILETERSLMSCTKKTTSQDKKVTISYSCDVQNQ
jgi:hypothetical protein